MLDSLTGGRKISDMEKVSKLSDLVNPDKVFIPMMDGNESQPKKKSKSLSLAVLKASIEAELASFVDITCQEFTNLYKNGGLNPGTSYCLIDFKSYMRIPGSLASPIDAHKNYTNIDFLGSSYTEIHPVLTASTPYTYGIGTLKEFPWIQVVWLPITQSTEYYGYGRMPDQAYTYGVIAKMMDPSRNIECEFDYINAVVRAPGKGLINHLPYRSNAREQGSTRLYQGSGFGFFKYNGATGDSKPNYHRWLNYGPSSHMQLIDGGVSAFLDQFLGGNDGGIRRTSGIYSTVNLFDGVWSRQYPNFCPVSALGNMVDEFVPTGGNKYEYYTLRDVLMPIMNNYGYGNAYIDEVRNIFIGRSPITPSMNYWCMSNVPLVVMSQKCGYEAETSNANSIGTVRFTGAMGYYAFRNIYIKDSDMIYIGRVADSGGNRRTIVDSEVHICCSFAIGIFRHYGEIKIDHCYFCNFDYLEYFTMMNSSYCLIMDAEHTEIDNANRVVLATIMDSRISRCFGLLQLFYESFIKDSEFIDIWSTYQIEEHNYFDYVYGKFGNIVDNVYSSKIHHIRGLNCNKQFIPVYGVLELRDVEIGYAGCVALCIGNNYKTAPVFDAMTWLDATAIKTNQTPTNNFDMRNYCWVMQGCSIHSDGANDIIVTANNSILSDLSSDNPYAIVPVSGFDILYNSVKSKIIRYCMGYQYPAQNYVYCLNF